MSGGKRDNLGKELVNNNELNIWEALIPVILLIGLLAYNIFFADGELLGGYSNHYILLIGGVIAAIVGFFNKVEFWAMFMTVWENLKSVFVPILILLLVGALAGTWMISGVVPSMVYYGLQLLNPKIFLAASVVICIIISLATGSSWTTSATVGLALIGIAGAMGISLGMAAGAVISGAYFGDKMSPLSDTTNLAPAMVGSDLFTHIKYMSLTTVPSIVIALIVFIILGLFIQPTGVASEGGEVINNLLTNKFTITPWLFLAPVAVIAAVVLKLKPIYALLIGAIMGGILAVIFQPEAIKELTGSSVLNAGTFFKGFFMSFMQETSLNLPDFVYDSGLSEEKTDDLAKLLSGKGVAGMLWTVYLVICAMTFGGIMESIGALSRISSALLSLSNTIFGLFASTVASCLALNVAASDQYLAIVIPGKMFAKAYEDKGLAPENLSRTLEDSGTVTSALIPWNTCGAYQSTVLGVSVAEYFVYAIFNWISPFMTLLFAAIGIKIRMLKSKE